MAYGRCEISKLYIGTISKLETLRLSPRRYALLLLPAQPAASGLKKKGKTDNRIFINLESRLSPHLVIALPNRRQHGRQQLRQ